MWRRVKKYVIFSLKIVGEGADRNNKKQILFHLFQFGSCPKLICLKYPLYFYTMNVSVYSCLGFFKEEIGKKRLDFQYKMLKKH